MRRHASKVVGASGMPLSCFGATTVDTSRYIHPGTNTVQATGVKANRASVAVLSFFQ